MKMMLRLREAESDILVETVSGDTLMSFDRTKYAGLKNHVQLMVDSWNRDVDAQFGGTMRILVGSPCVVKFAGVGEQRGQISGITSLVLGKDQDESIKLSEFTLKLESGKMVTVAGSMLSRIDKADQYRHLWAGAAELQP